MWAKKMTRSFTVASNSQEALEGGNFIMRRLSKKSEKNKNDTLIHLSLSH